MKYKIGQRVRLLKPMYGIPNNEAGKRGKFMGRRGISKKIIYILMEESGYQWTTPVFNIKALARKGEQLLFSFMEEL